MEVVARPMLTPRDQNLDHIENELPTRGHHPEFFLKLCSPSLERREIKA